MAITPEPCNFVIFGATGNLVQDKLLPALYQLEASGRFGAGLHFVAIARREWNRGEWMAHLRAALQDNLGRGFDAKVCDRLAERFDYLAGDHREADTYARLKEELSKPRLGGCENNVFYLAIPPTDFFNVVTQLHKAGFSGGTIKHRIVVEKPFGEDVDSARKLNLHLHKYFGEDQIYRIDHYLGKETVQ